MQFQQRSIPPRDHEVEAQEELERDQAIADLGQAVEDREQLATDVEQEHTDRRRGRLTTESPTEAADDVERRGRAIETAQTRRDARQNVLDDAQGARDREQVVLDDQQDVLDEHVASDDRDGTQRRSREAEHRARAASVRAEGAVRRAQMARDRVAAIERLRETMADGSSAEGD